MDQIDIHAMQKGVQQFLDIIEPDVEANCNLPWKPSDGFLPVIFRAILRRQFEGLQMISQSVESGSGFILGTLLRPACEEFIWAKYLVKIPTDDAQRLVTYFSLDEMYRSLHAQDKYAGRSITEKLGLLPYLENSNSTRSGLLVQLCTLGTRLDWPKNVRKTGRFPPVSWLAKVTEEQPTYDFIYHATSRFVHFSPHELLRRVWGNPWKGTFSVSSSHFGDYWAHFCLHWGLSLFLRTIEALGEFIDLPTIDLPTEMSGTKFTRALEVLKEIGRFGETPIITAEELNWPAGLK